MKNNTDTISRKLVFLKLTDRYLSIRIDATVIDIIDLVAFRNFIFSDKKQEIFLSENTNEESKRIKRVNISCRKEETDGYISGRNYSQISLSANEVEILKPYLNNIEAKSIQFLRKEIN